MKFSMLFRIWLGFFAISLALISACSPIPIQPGVYGPDPESEEGADHEYVRLDQQIHPELLGVAVAPPPPRLSSPETIQALANPNGINYRIGPGDQFALIVQVMSRDVINLDNVIVSPDGLVSLPRIGLIRIEGMTLPDAQAHFANVLKQDYVDPEVTILIRSFNNNKAYVLGQVQNPGIIHFTGYGSVLEALTLAGGVTRDTQGLSPPVNRVMISRGNEMVVWIDLVELLEHGNMALNARLENGDVVFVPQGQSNVAYVMGEVIQPGPLLLRSPMTVLDAVMRSGGLTRDGDPAGVYLVRTYQDQGLVLDINLADFVTRGDLRKNHVLREGDILYVAPTGAGRLNYYLTSLFPSMRVIDFTFNTVERFGIMSELRNRLWGQEGFVNTTNE